jgi:hexokinase
MTDLSNLTKKDLRRIVVALHQRADRLSALAIETSLRRSSDNAPEENTAVAITAAAYRDEAHEHQILANEIRDILTRETNT